MSQVTGALAQIRDRVQQQRAKEVERRIALHDAEVCVERALAKYDAIISQRDAAAAEWPLTEREERIWDKKIEVAAGILAGARDRLAALNERQQGNMA
jgi:hypothetical protein